MVYAPAMTLENHSSERSTRLRWATVVTTTLGNAPLAVGAVTIISGSTSHRSSDVVFGVCLAAVPLLMAWASIRLLFRRPRETTATVFVHLGAGAACCVINVFAGGFMVLGGGGLAASAFLLAVGLQAIGFALGLVLLYRAVSSQTR